MDVTRILRRGSRYGTPPAPAHMGEPWFVPPRSNSEAIALLRSGPVLKRIGAVIGGILIIALVYGFVSAPPPPPPIGPVNDVTTAFGPIGFRSPIGWVVSPGTETLDKPLSLFGPQADIGRAPVTINFLAVDVTDTYGRFVGDESTGGRNPADVLDSVLSSYIGNIGRGRYCTLDTGFGSGSESGVQSPAVRVVWLDNYELGSLKDAGKTTNTGACPTDAAAPRPSAGGTLTANASPAPEMALEQWFALPDFAGFKSPDSRKMLVVTLSYPAGLSADEIARIRTVYRTVTDSIVAP